jgi:hypothetical protein
MMASQPAAAQAAPGDRPAAAQASGHQLTPSPKPAKTDSVQRSKTAPAAGVRNAGQDSWTLNDALPRDSKARVVDTPQASPLSNLGRLNLDTGSVGIQTESQFKEGHFSDGRRVPGLETVKRDQPSYFGLSLSVPTHDKLLIPTPLAPRD